MCAIDRRGSGVYCFMMTNTAHRAGVLVMMVAVAGRSIGMSRVDRGRGAPRRGEGLFDTVDKITRRPVRVRVRHMFHALYHLRDFG